MEIPIFQCQKCNHLFDSRALSDGVQTGTETDQTDKNALRAGTKGRRMPSCPKCGTEFARIAHTRYSCDCEGCDKTADDLPELWLRTSFTVHQWRPVFHWEKGKKVRGDETGNTRAGNFEVLPTCPQNRNYCSTEHMLQQQEREYAYLSEAMNT